MLRRKLLTLGLTLLFAMPLVLGCGTCPTCPRENIYIPLVVHPALPPIMVPFEKGEFDKTDEERGYSIYTEDEMQRMEKQRMEEPREDQKDSGDLEI